MIGTTPRLPDEIVEIQGSSLQLFRSLGGRSQRGRFPVPLIWGEKMVDEDESSRLRLIDTYTDFVSFWRSASDLSVEGKLKKWRSEYMARYPSLLSKQVKDYESRGFNWQEESKENVFPYLGERLPEMERARDNLVELLPVVHEKARDFFGQEAEILAVIYVGIGCGAGWATRLKEEPALLFGLENIAECGWTDRRSLEGLIAHELGHLFHERVRETSGLAMGEGGYTRKE